MFDSCGINGSLLSSRSTAGFSECKGWELSCLLSWAGLGIKDQPQSGKTGVRRTQWMEQAQLLPQDNSLGSGSSVTSRRKHRSAGVNKLMGVCVVAELVPFNVPHSPVGARRR